jgi:hypothetical protein
MVYVTLEDFNHFNITDIKLYATADSLNGTLRITIGELQVELPMKYVGRLIMLLEKNKRTDITNINIDILRLVRK